MMEIENETFKTRLLTFCVVGLSLVDKKGPRQDQEETSICPKTKETTSHQFIKENFHVPTSHPPTYVKHSI